MTARNRARACSVRQTAEDMEVGLIATAIYSLPSRTIPRLPCCEVEIDEETGVVELCATTWSTTSAL